MGITCGSYNRNRKLQQNVQMTKTCKAPLDYPQCFMEVVKGSAWIHFKG